MFTSQKQQADTPDENRGCSLEENDILCGKDKTYAKHPGNRKFRERIALMKVPYTTAPTKQEKMEITRGIVNHMRIDCGSRFLKMENGAWVEIDNQAARDKVSHALRFASRNLKASDMTTSTSTNPSSSIRTVRSPRRNRFSTEGTDSSVSSNSTSEPFSELSENDETEPVPLEQVFSDKYCELSSRDSALFYQQHEVNERIHVSTDCTDCIQEETKMNSPAKIPSLTEVRSQSDFAPVAQTKTPNTGFLPEHPPIRFHDPIDSNFVNLTSQSFGSMRIDDNTGQFFDSLRSAELEEIFNQPLVAEWDIIAKVAES